MMRETDSGVLVEVTVKPNSRNFRLYKKDNKIILEVTSPPKEGKANLEIIKGLKRLFGREVQIVRGLKSREKLILVGNSSKREIEDLF